MKLTKHDLRWFVLEYKGEPKPQSYFQELDKAMRSLRLDAFYHFLMDRDLSNFNHREKPPHTEGHDSLIYAQFEDQFRYLEFAYREKAPPFHGFIIVPEWAYTRNGREAPKEFDSLDPEEATIPGVIHEFCGYKGFQRCKHTFKLPWSKDPKSDDEWTDVTFYVVDPKFIFNIYDNDSIYETQGVIKELYFD